MTLALTNPSQRTKKGVTVTCCSADQLLKTPTATAERIAAKLEKFDEKYQSNLNSDEAIRDRQVKTWRSGVYSLCHAS